MDKCQRCLKKEVSLKCLHCPTINRICNICDKEIHSTSLKINHNRIPIENITINLNENVSFENKKEPNENLVSNNNINKDMILIENNQQERQEDNNLNYLKNCSTILKNNNTSETMDNMILNLNNYTNDISTINQSVNNNQNDNPPNKYSSTTYYLNKYKNKSAKNTEEQTFGNSNLVNRSNDNYSYINNSNYNNNILLENSNSNNSSINNISNLKTNSVFNKKLLLADNYSKEYINEIKKIFKKEKDELEYKNKILESSINRLKIEFNGRVAYLTKELENSQSNNLINIKALQDNYQDKIEEIKKNNEMEVSSLKEEIINFQNDKNQLNDSFLEEINAKNIVIKNLQKENENLKNELNIKNNEIAKLKNSFEEITLQYENKYEDDKKQIINDYELKIKEIVEKVENSKNSLISMVDKREMDIKEILEQKDNEIQNLNMNINRLKDELNCHKTNLIKIRDEKNNLLKENQFIKNMNFQNECNGQVQTSEINNLKKENETLYEQIDKLKIELSKLDIMIYGKVRTKF